MNPKQRLTNLEKKVQGKLTNRPEINIDNLSDDNEVIAILLESATDITEVIKILDFKRKLGESKHKYQNKVSEEDINHVVGEIVKILYKIIGDDIEKRELFLKELKTLYGSENVL
jgi:hypothetical protein